MLLLIMSPFAYTPEMVPPILKPLLYLNPLSYFVLTFQQLICYGTWPDHLNAIAALAIGLGFFLAGFGIFKKVKYIFVDYA
jgi:ABC-type polysaccharide/polyol phosphate export permease